MLVFLSITFCVLIAYAVLIAYYKNAWQTIPDFDAVRPMTPASMTVSVIVPARNEEHTIGNCLASLAAQDYPAELTEIIIVNDYSTDATEMVIRNFPAGNVRLINLEEVLRGQAINSYKKKAIETAIATASGDLIITTDADCTAGPGWIRSMVTFQAHHQAAFIAAPVRIKYYPTLLGLFQSLDFLTLQGITAAAVYKKIHSMCNGANLAYLREVFYEVGGFTGIDNIASGDDMLLMHKIALRYPDRYFFLKSPLAIVETLPATDWRAFFQQRIRWASKAGKYDDTRIMAVLALVYGLNLLIFIAFFLSIVNIGYLIGFLMLIICKTGVEYGFVKKVAVFFSLQALMRSFFLLQPLHVFYTVSAGFLGLFGSYEWKKRKVK